MAADRAGNLPAVRDPNPWRTMTPSPQRLVVIGASAGGVAALRQLSAALPAGFPAPVLIVLHIGAHDSLLPDLIAADCALDVSRAMDGETLKPGTIRIAPPDRHLTVEDGVARLMRSAKENFARPAIDPLFRSAALDFDSRAIGVILTGMLDDGTAGLQAIKGAGGIAIVQDPAEAIEPSMPTSATATCAGGPLRAPGRDPRIAWNASSPRMRLQGTTR